MRPLVRCFALGFLAAAACHREPVDTDPGTDTDTDTAVDTDTGETAASVGIVIYPFEALVEAGSTVQLRARTLLADKTSRVPTGAVTWTLIAGDAQLDANGILTGTHSGKVLVRATAEGQTSHATPMVYSLGLPTTALSVEPPSTTLLVGQTALLTAWATIGEASGDIGASCSWASSDNAIATAGAAGAVTALAVGEVTVTATCGTNAAVSAEVIVQAAALPAPDLGVTAVRSTWVGGDDLQFEVDLTNTGGQSPPFSLDLYVDAATSPSGPSDLALWLPGLASGQSRTVTLPATFTGDRPASIASWVAVDRDGLTGDTDPSDNLAGPVALELPADLSADLRVEFYGLIVFGPGDAGVEGELFNDGPDDLANVVLWFERDQPGTALYSDLDPASSEVFEVVPTLASGESYYWMFEYNQAPVAPEEWYSCMYVDLVGIADPDITDDFACATVTE